MVTDAAWIDLNKDGVKDLVVVGEWMPVSVFLNQRGRLMNKTRDYFDREYSGWWNTIKVGDLDGDGRPELLIGNLGLNSQCQADQRHPAELYYKDFDNNGAIDPVLCLYTGDTAYPFMSRDELIQQVAGMSQRFPDYKSYANAKLTDIFSPASLKDAGRLRADCLRTMYFLPARMEGSMKEACRHRRNTHPFIRSTRLTSTRMASRTCCFAVI